MKKQNDILETIKSSIGIGESNSLMLSKKGKQKIHIWYEDSTKLLLNIKQRSEYCIDSTQIDSFIVDELINNGYEMNI